MLQLHMYTITLLSSHASSYIVPALLVLARQLLQVLLLTLALALLLSNLIFGLLVAVRDQLVEEATRLAGFVALRFGFVNVAGQITRCFIIDVVFVVVLVEVCCKELGMIC